MKSRCAILKQSGRDDEERYLHYSMSVVGGIIGGSAVALHFQFGSAQTNNILYMIIAVLGADFYEVFLRVTALIIYVFGLVSCTVLKRNYKRDLRMMVIWFEFMVILLSGILLPPSNHLIALYPYFLVSSVQWSFFAGAGEYACSSIFATNNLRICVTELTEFACSGDMPHLARSKFYAVSLFWYFSGVTMVFLTVSMLSYRCILLCIIPLRFSLKTAGKIKRAHK